MIEPILNCCCDYHINRLNAAREIARRAGLPPQATPAERQAQAAIEEHLAEIREWQGDADQSRHQRISTRA